MTREIVVLLEEHVEAARRHFSDQNGNEGAGYFHCGQSFVADDPWDHVPVRKYFPRAFEPIVANVVSSPVQVSWPTDSFIHCLRRSRENNEILAIIHSHPNGPEQFSPQDDKNERDLIELALKRNGKEVRLLSIVMLPDGKIFGRVWYSAQRFHPIDLFVVIGRRFTLDYESRGRAVSQSFLDRQALALGAAFNEDLRHLRVGVVGCGGTGSAIALLLPRLGFERVALFDNDCVDETNLNRLHFSSRTDARRSTLKIDAIRRGIEAMDLGTEVRCFPGWINDEASKDALKSCDVIFGCTDDNAGRILLNRFAYFYHTPVFDMGLAIDVGKGDPPRVHAFDGRVTVIQPQSTCLLCRGVVDLRQAEAESLKRSDPQEYQRRKAEAYVIGEGNPSPAVVTFTTAVAAMAVEEFIHRLQGFRGPEGSVDQRLRRFHLITDRRQGEAPLEQCPVCSNADYWGRGDIEPFLDASL